MGHSIKWPASSFILLFLILYNGHSIAASINVTSGTSVTISFTFNSTISIAGIKYANLYKDGNKTEQWPLTETGSSRRKFRINSIVAELFITSTTDADAGIYYVALFPVNASGSYIESLKEVLTVLSAVTGSPPTSYGAGVTISEGSIQTSSLYIYIISAFCVIGVLFVSLLSWFYLTSGYKKTSQGSHNRSKVTYTASSSNAVYSVEYGVLDFPSRPADWSSGSGPEPRDSVEYSTITFVQPSQQRAAQTQHGGVRRSADMGQTLRWSP